MFNDFLRAVAVLAVALFCMPAISQDRDTKPEMSFFVTSTGVGDGANLGGLEGADRHCQALAEAVGSKRTWRAYLSTQPAGGKPAVNARDRIGSGPWHNVNGIIIATDVDDLHYNNANIQYQYALTEKGDPVKSRALGDPVTEHDILTGTKMDGTAYPSGENFTCSNWTSNSAGKARVGHSDRYTRETPGSSWNSVHDSRGCSQEALVGTGGAGMFYCFAAD